MCSVAKRHAPPSSGLLNGMFQEKWQDYSIRTAPEAVLLTRPFLVLETKTETLAIRSRDRDLDKMNSSALESRDHGLKITTLAASILDIGDRALA